MNRQQLLAQARTIAVQLKNEERRSINPYASFTAQLVALIYQGQASSKDDILNFTSTSYSRPRMNRQWRTFNSILQKNLRPLDKESLLYLFGYLKRVLTIEGKREFENRKKDQKGRPPLRGRDSSTHRGKKNKTPYFRKK